VIPIVGSSGLMAIDLGCRGAVVGLSLLIAGVLLRDRGHSTVSRLSAMLLVSAAASTICSAPGFPWPWQYWSLFLLALSCGGSVIFWLWARATFDDDFLLQWWHGALWAAIVGLQVFVSGWSVRWPALGEPIDRVLPFVYLGFSLLGAAQTLATWRADLVAGRRRLRLVVLIGASAYAVASALQNFWPASPASGFSVWSVANVVGLLVLLSLSAWSLFQAAGAQQVSVLLPTTGDVLGDISSTAPEDESKPPAIDPELLRRLQQLMTVERAYRREGLTIGLLSAELGVPEYRLRQLINEGLGHRNFNAFLNQYRIEEARAALADPEQKDIPVLTIAMDTGFQSVGPFNRAFKAATDLTPTEFRRLALTKNRSQPGKQGDGAGISRPD
jgi:AraC-like DNA-binding protein